MIDVDGAYETVARTRWATSMSRHVKVGGNYQISRTIDDRNATSLHYG